MKKNIKLLSLLSSVLILGGVSALTTLTTSCGKEKLKHIHLSNFPVNLEYADRIDISATCETGPVTITATGPGEDTNWEWIDGKTIWYRRASVETIHVTFTFTALKAETISVILTLNGSAHIEYVDADTVFDVSGSADAGVTGRVSYEFDTGKVIKVNTDDVTFIGTNLNVSWKNDGKIANTDIVDLDDWFLYGVDGNPNIVSMTFPDTLTSISRYFLVSSNIAVLDLSNTNITRIDDGAFESAHGMTEITFPSTLTKLGEQNIDARGVFYNCNNLLILHFKGTNVPTLGGRVFEGTQFTTTHNVGQCIYTPAGVISQDYRSAWAYLYYGIVSGWILEEPTVS